MKRVLIGIYYSFPIQLLLLNFKKNQAMMLIWVLLFCFVTQKWGRLFGIPYLFLDPEYLDKVSPLSLFIMGVAFGIFAMSFQITNYILDSASFSFIGSLPKPFSKFIFNNFIIPLAFLITYLISFYHFQIKSGFQKSDLIIKEALAFGVGYLIIHFIMFIYFWLTNKDIFKVLASELNKQISGTRISRVNVLSNIKKSRGKKTRVDYYLDYNGFIKQVNKNIVFEKEHIYRVFDQNHLNAAIIQLIGLVSILILGFFRDNTYFQIPAGASSLILFSVFIMITGFLSYWFKGWAITGGVILFLFINWAVKTAVFDLEYQAFGLDYSKPKAVYNLNTVYANVSDSIYQVDKDNTITILENWKSKVSVQNKKPKIVFICTSGGGQRAAVWVMRTLQVSDSLTNGKLFSHTRLITGASGGMIGASFYRELYLRNLTTSAIKPSNDTYFYSMAKDVLNPVLFTMVVNDLFYRNRTFEYKNMNYSRDRGFSFEDQIINNSAGMLEKSVNDYHLDEKNASIPMMIFSPSIINDGRKLFISSTPVSYMCTSSKYGNKDKSQRLKGIEFMRFFKNQNAKNLRFSSALRMSATFPYITPNVTLPADPSMEIMDAGLSDNFGITDAVRFMYVFKDWINENTSGVIVVSIRDSEKEAEIEKHEHSSIIQKLFTPVGSLYNNWDFLQDNTNDNNIDFAQSWLNVPLHDINFQYIPTPHKWKLLEEKNIDPEIIYDLQRSERASLSWHLTTREKESLKRTIFEDNNVSSLNKLKKLLNE